MKLEKLSKHCPDSIFIMSNKGNSMSSYFSHFTTAPSAPGASVARQGVAALAAGHSSQRGMESQPLSSVSDSQSGIESESQSRFDVILNGNRLVELKRGIDNLAASQEATNASINDLTMLLKMAVTQLDTLGHTVETLLVKSKRLQRNLSNNHEEKDVDMGNESSQDQDVQEYLDQMFSSN